MRLERMIDNGIIARGNAAFLISDRSKTMLGVTLLSDNEKKFHTNSPVKRKK